MKRRAKVARERAKDESEGYARERELGMRERAKHERERES